MRVYSMMLLLLASALFAHGSKQASSQPFTIVISAEKPIVKAGSEVSITIQLTNTSKQALDTSANISSLTGVDPNYLYDVRDSHGNPAPKRRYEHPELATGHAVFGSVKPKETVTTMQDISRLFDLSKPGRYLVRVSRRVPHSQAEVRSNTVTLTVTP